MTSPQTVQLFCLSLCPHYSFRCSYILQTDDKNQQRLNINHCCRTPATSSSISLTLWLFTKLNFVHLQSKTVWIKAFGFYSQNREKTPKRQKYNSHADVHEWEKAFLLCMEIRWRKKKVFIHGVDVLSSSDHNRIKGQSQLI